MVHDRRRTDRSRTSTPLPNPPGPARCLANSSPPSRRNPTKCSPRWRRAQWVHGYVTDDKLFCVYVADSAETILEHAHRCGFPAGAVHHVRTVIDPDHRGSQREPPQRRAAALLALAACTIATPAGGSHARCDARTSTCEPDNPANPDHSGRPVTLNALQSTGPWEDIRAATRRSRDVDNAIDAGYVQIFGCVHEPLAGAMGIHFVNSQLAWPR